MGNTLLDYNNLPNIPREMRRALFKRYLAKLGGMGMYDPVSLEKVKASLEGFLGWLLLPLSLSVEHHQSHLIQQEEELALIAALWWLTRDRRINVRSRMIFCRWARMARVGISYDKKRNAKMHKLIMLEREKKIHATKRRKPGL